MKRNQDPNWLKSIGAQLYVEVGCTSKTVEEVLNWRKGTTVKLDDSEKNRVKVYVNNEYFADGIVTRNNDGEMGLKFKNIRYKKRGDVGV